MQTESEAYANHPLVHRQMVLGKVHFSSLRRTYDIIAEGKSIPKHDYRYRIDSKKLATAIKFLQDSLCVKPGVVRDVSIAGHVFEAMPVYERGGKSIDSLNDAYNNVFVKEE